MQFITQTKFALTATLLVLFAGLAPVVRADCPDDICDCIGEAGEFSLTASQAKIRNGIISASGYGEPVPSFVETSVCAGVAKVGGKPGGETEISEDALFTASDGVAVKFTGAKSYGETYTGAFVGGDIATGGGGVKGINFVEYDGDLDTTGAHPFIADCAQGLSDAVTGSATIAALTPTQNLGDLIISDGASYDINVGSGDVSVIEVGKLLIKPLKFYGYAYASTLNINLDGTNSVIINVTDKLAIGSACEIIVNGGDVEDVIINVAGTGPSVRIARSAMVMTPILAPQRKIVASANSYCSNLFAGKLIVKGSTVTETMFCP